MTTPNDNDDGKNNDNAGKQATDMNAMTQAVVEMMKKSNVSGGSQNLALQQVIQMGGGGDNEESTKHAFWDTQVRNGRV
jgi:hypothetical protein